MNPPEDKELAALIDRELKALPPLAAPAGLAQRILSAVAVAERAPRPAAGWQSWPFAWRIASLGALLALFAGLCFASVRLWQSEAVTAAGAKAGSAFNLLGVLGRLLATLADAAVQMIQNIGTGYVVAALVLIALAYAASIALGSFYVRFAMARR